MKKILTLLLAIITVLSFTACNSDTASNDDPNSASVTNSEKKEDLDNSQGIADNKVQYTLADAVIVNNEHCTFTITSIDPDNMWGFTVKALCENKSNINLMFSWDDVSVNGYMIDPFWASEVAAGKKSNVEISFSNSQLKKSNIASVEEIIFTLGVHDSDDWRADDLVKEEYSIYPTGIDAASVIYPERTPASGEMVFVDDNSCTFIIEGVEPEGSWGYTLNCYLVNKTSEPLMFSWDNVSVNGYMIDPFWTTEVLSGKRAYCEISFFDSDFEENGINNVEEIEFNLRIYSSENWSAPDIYNEIFTYNP